MIGLDGLAQLILQICMSRGLKLRHLDTIVGFHVEVFVR